MFSSLRVAEKHSKQSGTAPPEAGPPLAEAAELAQKKVPGSLCPRKESGKGAWHFFLSSESPRRIPRFRILTRLQCRSEKHFVL